MPNITQLIALREKYGSKNSVSNLQLKSLNENFRFSADQIKNSFSYQGLDTRILNFFESQTSADLLFLFLDITAFSQKCKNLTNSQLAVYLDKYYDLVIPIIYAHGGEVEKIMGDGIIAIFGQPFLTDNKDVLFSKADKCAKDIIVLLRGTEREVKIALHDGSVMYYKNKTLNYPEYTVIGKSLTELYRLESVAMNNSISYYHVSQYDNKEFCKEGAFCITNHSPSKCGYFNKSSNVQVNLQGVEWSFIKHYTCTFNT